MNLIARHTSDDNFAHCLTLLGPSAAWAETLEVGNALTRNDIVMVQIPVEVALAFMRDHVSAPGPIGDAVRSAFGLIDVVRKAGA